STRTWGTRIGSSLWRGSAEGVADAAHHPRRVGVLPAQLGEAPQDRLLLRVEARRRLDGERCYEVAAAAAAQAGHTLAAIADLLARSGAGHDLDVERRAVEARERQAATEGGRGHGHGDPQMQVRVVPRPTGRRCSHVEPDVEVTG